MFHLFSHCWSRLQAVREPVRKVTLLVVGLDNAGKTTLVMDLQRALAGEALPAAKPSQTQLRVDRFEVTLVDLPGGQRSRGAWRNHYGTAHGLLFVLDASDLARVEEARKVLARVLSHPNVSGKPLLLLANKQDAADALLPCELIERLSLEQLANANESPCRVEPCAAAARGPSRGALPGLRWLLRAADADYEALSARVRQPGQGAKKKKRKKTRNKVKSQESALEQQCEAVSSTFDLYRRVMLALKMRQEQRKQPAAIAP
ncbi:ADP-ribosylation factor-like protein 13A [Rhea pennata]|uniref:ADP-ribosylation factor-like protein 13A n=1 Tax=Rhea pennata TaxID=8795 RepID=UPI002E26B8B9